MAGGERQGAPHKGDFMSKGKEEGVGAERAREAGWSEPVAAEPTGNAEPQRAWRHNRGWDLRKINLAAAKVWPRDRARSHRLVSQENGFHRLSPGK